ncbi:NXT2 (predicted) [Pycnogonum litorale]
MAAWTTPEMKMKVDTACSAAETFSTLYYKTYDKKRHQLSKMYSDEAVLIWNGNGVKGKEAINKFLEELPSSEHSLQCLDAQPIIDQVVQGQMAILVIVTGIVKFEGNYSRHFYQTFMLTVQGDVWKVITDDFRFQEEI